VPSLQVAYVWHASVFAREVWNGLERIGFLYPQQLIWNKGTIGINTSLASPWKKNAPWYGKAGLWKPWGSREFRMRFESISRVSIDSPASIV
jgi:hypothetical protein